MKLVVPISTYSLDSALSMQFARSAFFAILDGTLPVLLANPYANNPLHAGRKVFNMLVNEMGVSTLAAYELGLKIQQMALKNKVQIIVLDAKIRNLQDVVYYRNRNK